MTFVIGLSSWQSESSLQKNMVYCTSEKVTQIAKEYREMADIPQKVLSDPLCQARYRAGYRAKYNRPRGQRAPFVLFASTDRDTYIEMCMESQGDDMRMSTAEAGQDSKGVVNGRGLRINGRTPRTCTAFWASSRAAPRRKATRRRGTF